MGQSMVYVGLDYHQNQVQVCVLDREGKVLSNRSCANDWRAIAGAAPTRGARTRVEAAIEASCGASDMAEELTARARWSVSLAHPGYVARMKRSPDKSDFSDARMLADLTRVGYLPRVWLAPEAVRELRRLTRYREGLVRERRTIKQRVGALSRDCRLKPPAGIGRWSKRWVAWLLREPGLGEQGRWVAEQHMADLAHVQERVAQVEERLAAVTADDPVVTRLRALKGVGLVTACVLRAEIGRFDRFVTGRQLSRFCGLSPRNASSGERQADAGLIDACGKALRATLIEAAHRLIRFEPRWRRLAVSMRARGKAMSLVAAAVANRWVRGMWHEMKSVQAVALPTAT